MKDWFSWLFSPAEDMPTTVIIAANFIVIEASIKLIYDCSVGAVMRLIDRIRKSDLSTQVSKVFDRLQLLVLLLSILCFMAEMLTIIYFIIQVI